MQACIKWIFVVGCARVEVCCCTQLIWQHMEDATAEDVDEGDAELFAEEERLLHSGNDDYPVAFSHSIERVHTSNIISVRWSKDGEMLLTGSGMLPAATAAV
jgi:hypothetical protein